MKKDILILLIASFVVGLLIGILMIEDIQTNFAPYVWGLYFIIIVGSFFYVNVKYSRVGYETYLYPSILLIMYIPINILAGYILNSQFGLFRYYGSYPRYEFILFYALFLICLYSLARLIDRIFKSKNTKLVMIITDVLTLVALPYLALVTYFVSPH
ncbi:hypothetical protein KQ51_01592 [Candidatus Izimaplasma bacterium HR1]|uniref:hypothetical protein n=1 Tax=Candidatus Izimoplasma sp. HR1 TaxID=1541959 RepID=UPI0004F7E521|nr:hypothetical protein KQ51_01592 [Candidatus Izimaplasma bacterium HR1]